MEEVLLKNQAEVMAQLSQPAQVAEPAILTASQEEDTASNSDTQQDREPDTNVNGANQSTDEKGFTDALGVPVHPTSVAIGAAVTATCFVFMSLISRR